MSYADMPVETFELKKINAISDVQEYYSLRKLKERWSATRPQEAVYANRKEL